MSSKFFCKTSVGAALLALIFAAGLPLATSAQNAVVLQYDIYKLSSEAFVEINNDLMTATLAVLNEDKDPAVLADKINSTAAWAVNILRPFVTITAKTRDYQTYPRYDSSQTRRLIGWRASQIIELETDDFEAAGKAIQQLQERLRVQSISLSAKAATRETASDLLISKALSSFKDRARLIQKNMNAGGFKIVEIDIQTGQAGPATFTESGAAMSEMSLRYVENEPAIEAGTTRVTVRVSGRIQLQ